MFPKLQKIIKFCVVPCYGGVHFKQKKRFFFTHTYARKYCLHAFAIQDKKSACTHRVLHLLFPL